MWLKPVRLWGVVALIVSASGMGIVPSGANDEGPAKAAVEWRPLDTGFDVAGLSVNLNGIAASHLILARIDPRNYRFILRSAPAAPRTPDRWLEELGAVMVINGSFFAPDRTPVTPLLSDGVLTGPTDYHARHGAFVASNRFTGVRDLRTQDWRQVFHDADNATVSYPLLLGEDGGNSVVPGDKRAHRSFVAQDKSGRIILGTTQGAVSLGQLAAFLKEGPLEVRLALNLDGGPYACQAIVFKGYTRNSCGGVEPDAWIGGQKAKPGARELPIVLAVMPR